MSTNASCTRGSLGVSGRNALLIAGVLLAVAAPVPAQTPAPDALVDQAAALLAKPVKPRSPVFSSLFTGTVTDFKRLPSVETAAILAFGGLAATIGHRADPTVAAKLSGPDHQAGFFKAGQTIGGGQVQLGGALATYAIGRAFGSRKTATVGADLVRANLVSQALTQAIKVSSRRSRPDGTGFSFPSGHTASSFAAATVLQRHFGWKAGLPAYGVASYVAVSRIQTKRHFLSDVAFGAALGIAAGRTVTLDVGRHRLNVAPTALPGGAGISLSVD